jgi:predicted  nucleic acid-binding Zn-ribbon protein
MRLLPTSASFLLAAIAAIGIVSADEPRAKPAPQQQPETGWAERTLYIPNLPDMAIAEDMVANAAAKHSDVLGVSPADAQRLVESYAPRDSEDKRPPTLLRVAVIPLRLKQAKPRAVEFLDAVTSSVDQQLREWSDQDVEGRRAERQFAETERDLKEASSRLEGFEKAIRKATGRVDVSLDAIRTAASKGEEERQTLKLQAVGKQARQKALAETIEQISKRAAARTKEDAVAEELQKVVEARLIAAKRLVELHASGGVSEGEVRQAEAAVAEARARVLERREAVAQSNGGDLLSALNRELAAATIDMAEAEAKLAAIEEMRQKYGEVQNLLTQVEDVRREREQLAAALAIDAAAVRDTRSRSGRPVLRVIRTESKAPNDPGLIKDLEEEQKSREGRGAPLFGGTRDESGGVEKK